MGPLLASAIKSSIDISSAVEVLGFAFAGAEPTTAIFRLDIGSNQPIVGSGSYTASIYLNGSIILPEFGLLPNGMTKFIAQSSVITLIPGDVVSIHLLGALADTNIDCKAYAIEAGSAINLDDVVTQLTTIITNALRGLNVSQERVVLGPCKQKPRAMPKLKTACD